MVSKFRSHAEDSFLRELAESCKSLLSKLLAL